MARQPMVTRTIVSTKLNVLCMDLVNRQPIEKEIVLPRTYKDDITIMKVLAKQYDSDELKVTAILSKEVNKDIYGMTEQKFLEVAEKLDNDRKFVETQTETETVEQ